MATVQNLYTGDGSTVLFSFTFPYIDEAHINVSVDGVDTTEYTLANATTVEFNVAPSNGAAIRIYRVTPDETAEATFFTGSAIRASDLNDNFEQLLFVAQESSFMANAASDTANSIEPTATAALAAASSAESLANTALSTVNSAQSDATSAVGTANAATAVANTASSNALNALNASNDAVTTANAASTTATAAENIAIFAANQAENAIAAAAAAVLYEPVVDLTALLALAPSNGGYFELLDSTGVESESSVTSLPGGFVGDPTKAVRLKYNDPPGEFAFIGYVILDPDNRYEQLNKALLLTGGTLTGTVSFDPGQTFPVTGIQGASTSQKGVVQLTDSIGSTSTNTAATPNAVKNAYDLANAALPKTGGTLTGDLIIASTGALTIPAGTTAQRPTPANGQLRLNTDTNSLEGYLGGIWGPVGGFESGTKMLFQQTAAPTGWTKSVTHNDKALRVVSGTAGSGGSSNFSAVLNGSVGATTLSTYQLASHTHNYSRSGTNTSVNGSGSASGYYQNFITQATTAEGGNGSHTHAMNVAYVDVIIATKD